MNKFKMCTGCGKKLPNTPEFYNRNKASKDGMVV